jgi:hypothetical protein
MNVGASLRLGIDYKDYMMLQNVTDFEYYSDGSRVIRNTTDLTNRFRDSRRDFRIFHSIDFGLRHQDEDF